MAVYTRDESGKLVQVEPDSLSIDQSLQVIQEAQIQANEPITSCVNQVINEDIGE